MDVKDVKPNTVVKNTDNAQTKTLQRALTSLSAEKIETAVRSDAVSVNVEPRAKETTTNETRKRANSLINVVNSVDDATEELTGLVESLDGIVEQASSSQLSESRSSALEREANEIVDAIREKSVTGGVDKPDFGDDDPIKSVAEQELGKTLDVIFQNNSEDAFGLESIVLSPPENILRTRANIDEARQRIQQLRDAVESAKGEAKQYVDTLDVALQNAKASESSVRDIDEALKLTGNLNAQISENPEAAQKATGLGPSSLQLLDQ